MATSLSALEGIARAVDDADDRGNIPELRRLVGVLEEMARSQHSAVVRGAIEYYLANAHSAVRKASHTTPAAAWDWSQPMLEREILHLRRALSELPDDESGDVLRSRVITNLANALDHVGRSVEAIALWDAVLAKDEEFGMALANKGSAYCWHARYVQPEDEQLAMLRQGRRFMELALTVGIEEHAKEAIAAHFRGVSSMLKDSDDVQIPSCPYGENVGEEEREYRQWCRREKLFLSHLSDLPDTAGVEDLRDNLVLPSIVVPVAEGGPHLPVVYGMFNQAKQEFVSARFMVYEAISERERSETLHFSDRGVLLYDALDYRIYRLWVERMKAAFLSAHAILDKLAYLMNRYWKLGLKPKEVSFIGVWFKKGKKSNGIAPAIEQARQNLPLRGLFWLSKDFHDSPADGELAPEPRMLHDIRNHIAHKYLRVHDHIVTHLPADRSELPDDFSFQVTDEELQVYTVKLLRLVRSAMIYLSGAVLHEELEKRKATGEGLLGQMHIHTVGDEYRL
jgi:hypothetical protein